MKVSYIDDRFGDVYEVEVLPDGRFLHAVRFVDAIGRDPIHYSRLSDIPSPHHEGVTQAIWQKVHGK